MAAKKVIDVSHHQGAVNWTTTAKKGIYGVMVRLAYATTKDTMISAYVPGVREAGLALLGGYGYATWHYKSKCNGSISKARELMQSQIDRWIAIATANGIPTGTYLAIDQEAEQGQKMGLSKTDNTTLLSEGCERIKKAGYVPVIYASASWIKSYMDVDKLDCLFWMAYYFYQGRDFSTANNGVVPKSAPYKSVADALGNKLIMWQFASSSYGKAYGMRSEGLDRDWYYPDRASGTAPAPTTPKKEEYCTVKLRTLQNGMSGRDVKALQTLLISNGFSCGANGADGIFGTNTDKGVREYQRAQKLSVDGVVGTKTWTSLLT